MRIVSLVPSWTETLIAAGLPPVGRTRYCIHPAAKVAEIPVIGGTKDVDWQGVAALNPELILADREENQREVLKRAPCPVFVSHVTDIPSLIDDLRRLEAWLCSRLGHDTGLRALRERWCVQARTVRHTDPSDLPAIRHWIQRPGGKVDRIFYMVWRDPWIAASRHTFIGAIFGALGIGDMIPELPSPYSTVDLDAVAGPSNLILFPSEPYPFETPGTIPPDLVRKGPCAIVDGEAYAWYGIRSLRMLEAIPPVRVSRAIPPGG
ncbi:helical backbone metal receptor [Aliiruegeria sabulilitoris]|uniref:helical backbone metal receptor n=1 Tax=Aliiruegeria sabulilitoris TaxID=1510458 RepID=UPI000831968E|nr:helical backbone metal receptor [Aliiruegeria sabulilitoris]NDR58277.1 hypothetical protein [Pseudoruegeria sp. M32A2M]